MLRWACALVTAVASAACSGDAPCAGAASTADCATAVRYQDTLYVEGGTSALSVEPLGGADLASCDDTGPSARGACFADDPPQVAVAQFQGHDPAEVLAARINDTTAVLFAEDVPEDVRREIARSGLVEPGSGPYTEDAFSD
ncbi:DUF6281 family protein [Candidatus Blastococcus massiliensis]|uniref:DUF6281 family protein n=1 Tax=Candidatus Blastococcus massiliensis TaxID=1470358 RepID=UPI0004B7F2DE|nr:DUF6281 family protein [Candidatus Blastococcus massiliensis]